MPECAERSRLILGLLLGLGDAQRLTSGQLVEALATCKQAAELARDQGSPADLARAALGVQETEIWIGGPAREAVEWLEAALQKLGQDDGADRARVLGGLGKALFTVGDLERAAALSAEAVALARRSGDSRALYWALSRQNVSGVGHPSPKSRFPERRKALNEELALVAELGDPNVVFGAGFGPFAAYLEMGDYSAFSASLTLFREYASKHRVSTFEWGLASADALAAILLGEFSEAERMADRALEIGGDVQGDLASGVYAVQMFTIRREQGRLPEVAPLFRRFLDENPRDAAWRPGLALIAAISALPRLRVRRSQKWRRPASRFPPTPSRA